MSVKRKIDLLVVHCSATQAKADIGAKDIDKWHRQRGWLKIGYHYVIRRNGVLEKGREEAQAGAHVEGHNKNSIGICLAGGIDKDGKGENNFTPEQFAALEKLLKELLVRYPKARICGHRDLFKGKECPCFNVEEWWKTTLKASS